MRVHGNAPGGFLSAATLPLQEPRTWPDVQWFAPGMICGGFEHLSPAAIGGREHCRPGAYAVRIREDRLPAPLLAGRFADGTTLAVLNPAPRGDTTAADGDSVQGGAMTDERFRFGAIGAEEHRRRLGLGYWFPGSEGEVTYAGNTYPGGQLHQWRRRFHPLRDGFEQRYADKEAATLSLEAYLLLFETTDLRGLGWQQEHYYLAPPRGQGLHRLWLPWVATSQLNGIFVLMEFDPQLFEALAARP